MKQGESPQIYYKRESPQIYIYMTKQGNHHKYIYTMKQWKSPKIYYETRGITTYIIYDKTGESPQIYSERGVVIRNSGNHQKIYYEKVEVIRMNETK